jgi:hypothetical protein
MGERACATGIARSPIVTRTILSGPLSSDLQ